MKDGRTHLAHKAEHAVDLETGAIVGVTVQGATGRPFWNASINYGLLGADEFHRNPERIAESQDGGLVRRLDHLGAELAERRRNGRRVEA